MNSTKWILTVGIVCVGVFSMAGCRNPSCSNCAPAPQRAYPAPTHVQPSQGYSTPTNPNAGPARQMPNYRPAPATNGASGTRSNGSGTR